MEFLRLAGLKETSERTCVIFLSRRDCERRRAHMLVLLMMSAMIFYINGGDGGDDGGDDDGDDDGELYMLLNHVKVRVAEEF